MFKKLQDAGLDPEAVKPRLRELLRELRGVADASVSPATSSDSQPEVPYVATHRGLAWLKNTDSGVVATPLTNFTAQIVSEQLRDDGVEVQRTYEIAATLNDQTLHFSAPASHFSSMGWVSEHLGPRPSFFQGSA